MKRGIASRLAATSTGVALALLSVSADGAPPKQAGTLNLTSPAFPAEGAIPPKYTCEGGDVSPPLAWSGAPAGTVSLALICDDPDAPAGTWVHWVLYNLPASTGALAEKVAASASLPNGAKQGTNDFGKIGYGGPCPPPGKAHHYFFKLYALDAALPLKPGATKADLLQAMEHHILGDGVLMAKYQRKK